MGFANKAMWRVLTLDTLVWAYMYDDTVIHAGRSASLSLDRMCSPKIEPEVVFKLRTPVETNDLDPAAVLGSVEWLALVSSGTFTEAQRIAPGETWAATVDGIDLGELS